MKFLFILVFLSLCLQSDGDIKIKNVWIKTFQNYKNYNIIINNISKTENKLANTKNSSQEIDSLQQRLSLYRSKISLYDKNNNFDEILRQFKYTIPQITLRDFLFQSSQESLQKMILKYKMYKNDFYLAIATLQNNYQTIQKNKSDFTKLSLLQEDLNYFNEYSENVEKIDQNLLETQEELQKKYTEYKDEVFIKHLLTVGIIFVLYCIYKIIATLIFHFTENKENKEEYKNYKKLLSVLFLFSILLFIIVRYIDDLIYIITFLSVVAAALTIAMKEILLNIAGAIYIFFSSVIKVGDRVMVQFETKHTIGDITDISLVKIKLNEIEDYSNIKEIKTVGRTIYIPNSYIFTKVFYNYSLKKDGIITDLIEFEFDINNDFDLIDQVTQKCFDTLDLHYSISFALNSLKTAILANISYQTNYKDASKNRGKLSILLLQEYGKDPLIRFKTTKKVVKTTSDEE